MKPGRQIGHIQTAIIGLRSVWLTLFVAIISIWKSSTSVMTRDYVDEKMRWWANKMLGYVDLSFNLYNPTGFEFQQGQRYLVMCNHASHYDIPLTFAALDGSIRMIGKKEMFDLPIWGRGARLGEFISIDRSDREQALKDLEIAREKMESGIIIWIAPEGTRSRSGNLLPLKKGGFMLALETGAQIVPLGIRGAANVLPPGTKDLCLGCEVDLYLGEPIDASKYTMETRDELIAAVERSLMELADVGMEAQPAEA